MPVYVRGVAELEAAFRGLSKDASKALEVELATIAEPVRERAQQLAGTEITNMTERWSQMKIGGAGRLVVYVAPKARRRARGSPRPNLAGLLLERSLWPAADMEEPRVAEGVERLIDRLAEWQFR